MKPRFFKARIPLYAMPVVTRTQIICGNCAGDELLPRPTLMTKDDNCWDCGGRNYVLASQLCISLSDHLQRERQALLRTQERQHRNVTNLNDRRFAG